MVRNSNNAVSFIHQWLYSPLLGSGRFFDFVILYSQYNSLDGGSARRKAIAPFSGQ
jgi:hypothetical protein